MTLTTALGGIEAGRFAWYSLFITLANVGGRPFGKATANGPFHTRP